MKNKVDDRGWTEEVMLEFGVFFGVAHRLLSTVQPKIPWFSSSFLLFDDPTESCAGTARHFRLAPSLHFLRHHHQAR